MAYPIFHVLVHAVLYSIVGAGRLRRVQVARNVSTLSVAGKRKTCEFYSWQDYSVVQISRVVIIRGLG